MPTPVQLRRFHWTLLPGKKSNILVAGECAHSTWFLWLFGCGKQKAKWGRDGRQAAESVGWWVVGGQRVEENQKAERGPVEYDLGNRNRPLEIIVRWQLQTYEQMRSLEEANTMDRRSRLGPWSSPTLRGWRQWSKDSEGSYMKSANEEWSWVVRWVKAKVCGDQQAGWGRHSVSLWSCQSGLCAHSVPRVGRVSNTLLMDFELSLCTRHGESLAQMHQWLLSNTFHKLWMVWD